MIHLSCWLVFMFALIFSRYFWISSKTKISFKPGPILKVLMIHDDYVLYLWFDGKWIAKLIHDISVLELRWNTCLCKNYTPLRDFPLFEWIRCFLLCSLETKCKLILISFGSVNFIFVLSFLTIEYLKNVVLITLEVDSLQVMFIVFGVEILKHFYTHIIVICSCFSILCLRTNKILGC